MRTDMLRSRDLDRVCYICIKFVHSMRRASVTFEVRDRAVSIQKEPKNRENRREGDLRRERRKAMHGSFSWEKFAVMDF